MHVERFVTLRFVFARDDDNRKRANYGRIAELNIAEHVRNVRWQLCEPRLATNNHRRLRRDRNQYRNFRGIFDNIARALIRRGSHL